MLQTIGSVVTIDDMTSSDREQLPIVSNLNHPKSGPISTYFGLLC